MSTEMGQTLETKPCAPADDVAIACAMIISRTDGYALPWIWISEYVPPPCDWQSGVFESSPPVAQSHAPL